MLSRQLGRYVCARCCIQYSQCRTGFIKTRHASTSLYRAGAASDASPHNSSRERESSRGHEHHRSSSALHFYQNRQLELYAARETRRLTLRQLMFYGRSMDESRLISAANYVRSELPVRIAHRLRDMQMLPYIVVTQEEVARVYDLYWNAFDKFRMIPPIMTIEDNLQFCSIVRSLLNEHAAIIPSLVLGLSLSSHHLPPERLDAFMRRMLVSRISRRVLAEHHLALTKDFMRRNGQVTQAGEQVVMTNNPTAGGEHGRRRACNSSCVGIIHTELSPREVVEECVALLRASPHSVLFPESKNVRAELPRVTVGGHLDTKFAYIRDQFEYIVFELLKNAIHATACRYPDAETLPDIHATIATGQDEVHIRLSDQGGGLVQPGIAFPSDLFSFSHVKNTTRLDRTRIGALKTISGRPEGMKATVDEQVSAWRGEGGDASPECNAGVGTHTRLGIGLPMSNIFATYFGGSLNLVSLDGLGTDAYLRLPKLGTKLEGIEHQAASAYY